MAIDTATVLETPTAHCRQSHLSRLFSFSWLFSCPMFIFAGHLHVTGIKKPRAQRRWPRKIFCPQLFAIFAGAKSDQNFHHSRH